MTRRRVPVLGVRDKVDGQASDLFLLHLDLPDDELAGIADPFRRLLAAIKHTLLHSDERPRRHKRPNDRLLTIGAAVLRHLEKLRVGASELQIPLVGVHAGAVVHADVDAAGGRFDGQILLAVCVVGLEAELRWFGDRDVEDQ
jgi:hypothetical protein